MADRLLTADQLAVPDKGTLAALTDNELLNRIHTAAGGLRAYLQEAVDRGLTQARISEALGVSQQAVSKRMRALNVEPSQPHRHAPEVTTEVVTSGDAPMMGTQPEEVVDGEIVPPPGQMEFDERTAAERISELPNDLADRVRNGALPLDEAEDVAEGREERMQIWAADLSRAISVLSGLAGHPVPAGLINRLDKDEQETLTLLLAGVPAEEKR